MGQYNSIKQKYPDAILLFRIGDFYETFGKDAIIAASVLGIQLTKRNNGAAMHEELAGFPHHAVDNYLPKLVKAGYRVAICDQLEDPKLTKTIVKRGVTEIVTPGVTTHDTVLDHKRNNYLACIHFDKLQQGVAFLDISTGDFLVAEGNLEYVDKLMQSLHPSELIYAKPEQERIKMKYRDELALFSIDDWVFQLEYSNGLLLKHFKTNSLKGFGIDEMTSGTIAAGAILHYLNLTEHPHVEHISKIARLRSNDSLWLDRFTIRNLELLQTNYTGGKSLIEAIDRTLSPMGARLLRRWLIFPLIDLEAIQQRHLAIASLIANKELFDDLASHIKLITDLERLISKLPMGKLSPRDLLQLKRALTAIVKIQNFPNLYALNPQLLSIINKLDTCQALFIKITNEIQEDAPALPQKGGVFKPGVNAELDSLRAISYSGKDFLLAIEKREREATGINSLKIGFNNVFGYYLEVTQTHKNKVPPEWIRKQTLANAERYITPEIKEFEDKILGAEERIASLETELYKAFCNYVMQFIGPTQVNALTIAELDCLLSFSTLAIKNNYTKPTLHDGIGIAITQGRHPVIEQQLPLGEPYMPNDVHLNTTDQQIIIITGPNMSGKSAILRQTALIVLLAQMGSYVPAAHADIGLVDRLFTRVGASDNISSGESTFMVEMNETASIMNNLTPRSLIILDEIGRGTSTFDGISIAWSISEYLHTAPEQPLTLFATHYHELNELEAKFERIKNYHVSTTETNTEVVFLRKLTRGGSKHSFGIQVAKMAGMPIQLIARAEQVLLQLEAKGDKQRTAQSLKTMKQQQFQLSLFDADNPFAKSILQQLHLVEINKTTPVDALMLLQQLKQLSDKM